VSRFHWLLVATELLTAKFLNFMGRSRSRKFSKAGVGHFASDSATLGSTSMKIRKAPDWNINWAENRYSFRTPVHACVFTGRLKCLVLIAARRKKAGKQHSARDASTTWHRSGNHQHLKHDPLTCALFSRIKFTAPWYAGESRDASREKDVVFASTCYWARGREPSACPFDHHLQIVVCWYIRSFNWMPLKKIDTDSDTRSQLSPSSKLIKMHGTNTLFFRTSCWIAGFIFGSVFLQVLKDA